MYVDRDRVHIGTRAVVERDGLSNVAVHVKALHNAVLAIQLWRNKTSPQHRAVSGIKCHRLGSVNIIASMLVTPDIGTVEISQQHEGIAASK